MRENINQIWVGDRIHQALKIASAVERKTMRDIVEAALEPALEPYFLPAALDKSNGSQEEGEGSR
ncbi:MAG TPA: hypothetical protein PLN42_00365 [Anaerolineae bacterium]|nr:hypothetical protein [Anaerolineae bacterium]